MRKKEALFFIMVLILCMTITGCNKQEQNNMEESPLPQTIEDSSESNQGQEESSTSTTDLYAEEYAIITAFYDGMIDLNDKLTSRQFTVLSETISELYDEFEAFDELANSSTDSIYSEYYSEMLANPFYQRFRSDYYEGRITESIDIDRNFLSGTYAYFASSILKDMMYVKLPFDYDKQLTKDSAVEANEDYTAKKALIIEMIMKAIDEGVDCALDTDNACAYTCDKYYTSSNICWQFGFEFHENNYFPGITISDPGNSDYNVTNVTFDNGTASIDFNSDYIDNMGLGINYLFLYRNDFSDEMNQKYRELKEMLKGDGDITISANGDSVATLTSEQKQTFKDYFDMFDTVIMIMEN